MSQYPADGGCSCGKLRYSLVQPPICVHACYCRYCQRETGASYALNATIETKNVKFLNPNVKPDWVNVPTASGKGQLLGRCSECRIAVFSIYGGRGTETPFLIIRGGTLDNPDLLTPTAQIYTETKQPWIKLADDIPAFEAGYDPRTVWTKEALQRFQDCTGRELTSWIRTQFISFILKEAAQNVKRELKMWADARTCEEH